MRIGILTDIHECTDLLRDALSVLRNEGADMFVTLGDTADSCQDIDATAALLREVDAIGVWGNHDIGLCRDVDPETASRLAPETLRFMATLEPRIELDGCLFMHEEPWLDPYDVEQLWQWNGLPDTPDKLDKSFRAVPHRRIVIGHFHRWLAATPAGSLAWCGDHPLKCDPAQKYLVVVGGICDGRFAILDTTTDMLVPYSLPR